MEKFILGLKLGMSQMFDEKGNVVPLTLVEAGPCQVTQMKTKEKDGYEAVQIGFKQIEKKIKKSMKKKPFRYLKEFKIVEEDKSSSSPFAAAQVLDVSLFNEGDKVKISGVSKGKGFQGPVKRWGFSGRNATHGVKHEHRTLGSVGTTGPQRVMKGKKMAGRMGSDRVTVKNLKVVKVDKENNLLAIAGAVPGKNGSLLEIRGR
ncbi:MAG: 50S ribosomal protein L3 [Candidatus Nealsonbacteria bacterium]|nr:50S ribosomal protein L3 [Candidatus Nealsonbacteria bacterium]